MGDLLALADPAWVADLAELAEAAYDALYRPFAPFKHAVIGPTFAGSRHVKADADLIIDGCLLDIKTTMYRRRTLELDVVYQLLGYLLLDYHDEYGIDSIAIYLSRLATLVRWPLDELLATLTGDGDASLQALRADFCELLHTRSPDTALRMIRGEYQS